MKKILNIFALSAAILAISAVLASCQKETATPQTPAVRVILVDLDATVAETKAAYAEKVVTIQDDDQLYITLTGAENAWTATGTLTYTESKFSGDVTVNTGSYTGSDPITDAKDLTATFLPKGYNTVGFLSSTGEATATKAFYAGTKSAAVPQLVHLTATVSDKAGVAKTPLTLTAQNSVLCYSINANKLSAGAHTVSVSDGTTTISGSVTAVADAATTFAVAFPASASANDYTLSISGYNNVVKSGKMLTAGKVVNIISNVTENFVDLGLSVKWAACNLGASNPGDYGKYYAWGETVGYEPIDRTFTPSFSWSNYSLCGGSYYSLTKYNNYSLYGTVDDKTVLDEDDDAATVALGVGYHIPTMEQWEELNDNCIWTITTLDGHSGLLGVSTKNGYTDKTIFLPTTGIGDGVDFNYAGAVGYYWSSSLYTSSTRFAYCFYFNAQERYAAHIYYRNCGFTVRPVQVK